MTKRKRLRNSNIEMLRIIAMLLIVMHHYSYHGLGDELAYSANRYVAGAISVGFDVGVTLFILISGYYMCESRITARKLLQLWGQIVFYTLLISGIAACLFRLGQGELLEAKGIEIGVHTLVEALLPIGYETYWFATDYMILMLISPFLNRLLHSLKRNQLRLILVTSTVIWFIIPTVTAVIHVFRPAITKADYNFTDLIWFVILYLYAGYIRMHAELDGNYQRNLLIALASYAAMALFAVLMVYAWHATGEVIFVDNLLDLADDGSPFALLCSIELFLAALKMQPRTNGLVNLISASTFGVYLFHDHKISSIIIWQQVLGLPGAVYDSPWMILHVLASVIGIFVIGVLIDIVRQGTVERLFLWVVDRVTPYVRHVAQGAAGGLGNAMDWLMR